MSPTLGYSESVVFFSINVFFLSSTLNSLNFSSPTFSTNCSTVIYPPYSKTVILSFAFTLPLNFSLTFSSITVYGSPYNTVKNVFSTSPSTIYSELLYNPSISLHDFANDIDDLTEAASSFCFSVNFIFFMFTVLSTTFVLFSFVTSVTSFLVFRYVNSFVLFWHPLSIKTIDIIKHI